MSLVVARKYSCGIYVVADTRLSHPSELIRQPDSGALKATILSPTVCVAFAGNVEYADDAIKSFVSLPDGPGGREITEEHFLKWHRESETETDFIVASVLPEPRIVQISNGKLDDVEIAHIGSERSFARFQAYMTKSRPRLPAPEDEPRLLTVKSADDDKATGGLLAEMFLAMSDIGSDMDIPEVGGYCTLVAFDKGAFQFMPYADITRGRQTPGHVLTQSSAAEGGCWFCFCCPLGPSRVAAVYFLQPHLGIVFAPRENGISRAEYIRNVSAMRFREEVFARFGVVVPVMFWDPPSTRSDLLGIVEYMRQPDRISKSRLE